jgi:predicted Zn-dependent peptidase
MINATKLSNGITVVMENMSYLKSVSFGIWIKLGSAYEDSSNNGISHLLEHMFFKGTTNRTAKQLADDMTKIGGNMNAYTSKECTSFYLTTLDEYLPFAINMVGDMINNSTFEFDDLKKEKSVVIEEIDMYDDSPEDLSHEMLQKMIWKDHPLGYIISGEKDIVRSLTREQLIEYKNSHYTADNMIISVAGNFVTEQLIELLEQNFGSIQASTQNYALTVPKYNRCIYKKEKDIEQLHLNIAFPSITLDSEDRYELTIMNAILGGNANSLLFQRIREEKGLTYSIYSYGSSYTRAGLFHIYAATNPEPAMEVFDEMIKIIEEIKVKGFLEKDIEETKEQIKINLTIANESTKNRMNSNAKVMMNRNRIVDVEETIRKVNAVTKETLDLFIKQSFDLSQSSISLVGNLDRQSVKDIEDKWTKL